MDKCPEPQAHPDRCGCMSEEQLDRAAQGLAEGHKQEANFINLAMENNDSSNLDALRNSDMYRVDTYVDKPKGGWDNSPPTAVRITHIPSGKNACSSSERSVYRNREAAMKLLQEMLTEDEKNPRTALVLAPVVPIGANNAQQDARIVATLERLLVEAKAGRIVSLAFAAVQPDRSVVTQYTSGNNTFSLLGAVNYLNHRLLKEVEDGD